MAASNPTLVPARVTVLSEACRSEMLSAAGMSQSAHWPEADRWAGEDYLGNWQDEAPEGSPKPRRRRQGLPPETRAFLHDGGYSVVSERTGGGEERSIVAHRGVLFPGEYVSAQALQEAVEEELGFTYSEVRSVFRQGPKSHEQRSLRDAIESRLLSIAEAGGQMLMLAAAFGWTIKPASSNGGASCDTMERALARARDARLAVSA